ncbi:MAG: hypothetical protein EXS24_00690 [Pedosphaera sp.]|nr:hypothetical protein [Pedosphaera sp.]
MKRIILLTFGLLAGVGTMAAGENPFGNIMGSLQNYPISFAYQESHSISGYWRPEMPASDKSAPTLFACNNGQNKVGAGSQKEGYNRTQGNKTSGEGYGSQGGNQGGNRGIKPESQSRGGFQQPGNKVNQGAGLNNMRGGVTGGIGGGQGMGNTMGGANTRQSSGGYQQPGSQMNQNSGLINMRGAQTLNVGRGQTGVGQGGGQGMGNTMGGANTRQSSDGYQQPGSQMNQNSGRINMRGAQTLNVGRGQTGVGQGGGQGMGNTMGGANTRQSSGGFQQPGGQMNQNSGRINMR